MKRWERIVEYYKVCLARQGKTNTNNLEAEATRFCFFLDLLRIKTPTARDVAIYFFLLRLKGLKKSSMISHLSRIKALFKWLKKEKNFPNIAQNITLADLERFDNLVINLDRALCFEPFCEPFCEPEEINWDFN